jgi:tRNA (adenine37-N6)-methyltransferase
MSFILNPIGIIHSPFIDKSQTPIQASCSQAKGVVEVYPDYAEGLLDLEGFSNIFFLYTFHVSLGHSLLIKPSIDDHLHDLFTTRYPVRHSPRRSQTVGGQASREESFC